jgi:hypothetical protein
MKKFFIVIIVVLAVLVLGSMGYKILLQKSGENGSCKNNERCQEGLKCINSICSSGKANSYCVQKEDCSTNFCVKNKCTEGKKDDACSTYKDCEKGLFCKKEICSEPPSYSQYFNKIVISKMKVGLPPGPDNIPVPTTEFKTDEAIEIDFVGVKPTVKGEGYYEAIDSITGEVMFSSSGYKMKFEGRDIGTGSDLPRVVGAGEFELNFYYNDEIVYTTAIQVAD